MPIMKKLILTLAIALAATVVLADEGHKGKSCDMMKGGKEVTIKQTSND